jgi:hypothetical protein
VSKECRCAGEDEPWKKEARRVEVGKVVGRLEMVEVVVKCWPVFKCPVDG